ncbi:MAG: hypothetical protein ACKOEF_04370 [Acidimicrobiaceae bacterium]
MMILILLHLHVVFARVALPKFDVADEEADEKAGGETGDRESEEAGKEAESEKEVSQSPNRASALAELAALAENVERCRERIVALAESQRLATYDPKKPENDDGLLMAIYEAERGLINAVRLLQRAARSR